MLTPASPEEKKRSITVAARSSDPRMFRAQRYGKVFYLRKTTPEPELLVPLAAFLMEHIDNCVAGEMNPASQRVVLLYSGKTEAQLLRERKPGSHTENIIASCGLDRKLAKIGEWQFQVIEPGQSDEEYWNTQADRILSAGISCIVIGHAEMRLTQQAIVEA